MNERVVCKRCLYDSGHPLGLVIDEDGICSGCRIHEEKDALDWDYRWGLLENIVDEYRCSDKKNYDCIVPVSGASDSYFIMHVVKNLLGLNPLVVTYNNYWNTQIGIKNLANLRMKFNCDILIQNVNPISVKKIVRTTLGKLGSIYWHSIAGQTVFPVQTAVRYKIPLIIWGAHQGMEQVGMFSHRHEVEMSRRYRKDHDLMGFEADDLVSNFDVLKDSDIWQYRYPDDSEIRDVGVRGIYLNNYLRWDPKSQHELMIKKYGFRAARFKRTFDCYDFVDCFNYMNLHDLLKSYKHGYTKVTDHACREIRHGRLNRSDAVNLVSRFEFGAVEYIDLFCKWLNIKKRSLEFILDTHRNSDLWVRDEDFEWKFLGVKQLPHSELENSMIDTLDFKAESNFESDVGDNYIIIGKGWP